MTRVLGVDPGSRVLGLAIIDEHGVLFTEAVALVLDNWPASLQRAYDTARLWARRGVVVVPEQPSGKHVPVKLWEILGAFKAGCCDAAWVHPGMPVSSWKLASVGKGNASKAEVAEWVAREYGFRSASQDVLDAVAIAHAGAAWWATRKEGAA